jgi:hypothetical protein
MRIGSHDPEVGLLDLERGWSGAHQAQLPWLVVTGGVVPAVTRGALGAAGLEAADELVELPLGAAITVGAVVPLAWDAGVAVAFVGDSAIAPIRTRPVAALRLPARIRAPAAA